VLRLMHGIPHEPDDLRSLNCTGNLGERVV
jgi:hypothetical protein